MATGTDQAAGYAMVSLAVAIFSYYTLWVIVLPFVDSGHAIQSFFLPPAYALVIPLAAGVVLLLGIGAFIAVITWKNKSKKVKSS